MWLGSSVFDGAQWFEGVAPDLDLHCRRVNRSAEALGLKATMPAEADRGADPRGPCRVFRRGRGLYPADVLGRGRRLHGRAGRPGIHPLLPLPLRDADDRADGLLGHRLAVPPADAGDHADARQGRLPLSQQRPRHPGGAVARLRQRPRPRHAGQRRRDWRRRTSSSSRTGWSTRRCRTAASSTESPASA